MASLDPPCFEAVEEARSALSPGRVFEQEVCSAPVERAASRVCEEEDSGLTPHHLVGLYPVASSDRECRDRGGVARDLDFAGPCAVYHRSEAHGEVDRLVAFGAAPGELPDHRVGVEGDGAHGVPHGLQSAELRLLHPPRDQPQSRTQSPYA